MWHLLQIGQAVSEKNMFKDYTLLYMCIAQVQGRMSPGG